MTEPRQVSKTTYIVPSEEEIVAKALKTEPQQEMNIAKETEDLNKIFQKQSPFTPTPPAKTDILIELIEEREKLKTLRQAIEDGKKRPSKQLTAIFYATQLVISANKIILDALKENIQINTENVDITTQINELIEVSREPPCNNSKENLPEPS